MKMKLKKALSMVLIMISVLALFAQSAFAIEMSQKLLDETYKTNEKIYKAADKAKEKAEKEALKENKTEDEFNEYLNKLIEKLIDKTEKTADKLIEKAAKEGIGLEKEYETVYVYGILVEIDPFYAH